MPMTPGDIFGSFSCSRRFSRFSSSVCSKQRAAPHCQDRKPADSRVILLVHRQETMSFLGFPVLRYIDVNDSEEVLRASTSRIPTCRSISCCTRPEFGPAALQIARAIHKHKGRVTALSRTMRCPAGR